MAWNCLVEDTLYSLQLLCIFITFHHYHLQAIYINYCHFRFLFLHFLYLLHPLSLNLIESIDLRYPGLISSIIGALIENSTYQLEHAFYPKLNHLFHPNHIETMLRSNSCNISTVSSSKNNSDGNTSWQILPEKPRSDLRDHLNHNRGGGLTLVPLKPNPIHPTSDIQAGMAAIQQATVVLNNLVIGIKNLVLLIQENHAVGAPNKTIYVRTTNSDYIHGRTKYGATSLSTPCIARRWSPEWSQGDLIILEEARLAQH